MKGEWTVEDAADGGGEYRGLLQDGRRIFVDGKPLLFRTPEHAQSVADRHNAVLRAAVEEEREACAEVAQAFDHPHIADAIRRRAEEPGGGA